MTKKVKVKEDNSLKRLRERSEKLALTIKAFEPKVEEFNRFCEEKKEIDMQILVKENEALKIENEALKAGKSENVSADLIGNLQDDFGKKTA